MLKFFFKYNGMTLQFPIAADLHFQCYTFVFLKANLQKFFHFLPVCSIKKVADPWLRPESHNQVFCTIFLH